MKRSIRDYEDTELRELGRSICDAILADQVPGWAGAILGVAQTSIDIIPVVRAVVEASADRERWRDCEILFSDVREETLIAEREGTNTLRIALLLLAENIAKLIFNVSHPDHSFDTDACEWIAVCLIHLMRALDNDDLSQRLEDAFFDIP